MRQVLLSDAYVAAHPGIGFVLAEVNTVDRTASSSRLTDEKRWRLDHIRKELDNIREVMACYTAFFNANGFRCPLPGQLEKTLQKGFPNINPYVDALIVTEMSNGLLMGVQDGQKIAWPLLIDTAAEGETFRGMRGDIRCRKGEIVIRDVEGIIASYFQGPDSKTSVSDSATDVVFYGFLAPGVPADLAKNALAAACTVFDPGGQKTSVDYYGP